MAENKYVDQHLRKDWSDGNRHRGVIGGLWDEIGQLQFDYMVSQGLNATDRMIDIGCGSLRGGSHFIPYLDPGGYFGFDINRHLIDLGLEKEITDDVRTEKVVDENFHAADEFDYPEGWSGLDCAFSLSLFTHLSLNTIRLCLFKTHRLLKPGALYHSSVFVAEPESLFSPIERMPNISTHCHKDPFHYLPEDLAHMAHSARFTLLTVKPFGHPRGQQMAVFRRD